LRVKAPSGTGPQQVQVNVQGGASDPTVPAALYSYGPLIKHISPAFGPANGGNKLTITGHNLAQVQKVEFLDQGTLSPVAPAVMSFARDTATSLTLTVPAPSAGLTPGGVIVKVTGLSGTPDAGANDLTTENAVYSYGVRVTHVSPTFDRGSGKVVISGHGFTPGSTVMFGSANAGTASTAKGSAVLVNKAGTLITIATTPDQAEGDSDQIDVRVVSGGAWSPTVKASKFSYGPLVSSLSVKSGSPDGGTKVVIRGKNFQHAVSVIVNGSEINSKGTSITVNTPLHAAGIVNVTVASSTGGTSPASAKLTFTFY